MANNNKTKNITEAIQILAALGLPRAQQNERSALCFLALLNITPEKTWSDAELRRIGIRGMLDFARQSYDKPYAENTRESLRRQTMHQFVQAQIALYNPDDPKRAVNSPNAVYQAAPAILDLVRTFGTGGWGRNLAASSGMYTQLVEKFGKAREMAKIPVKLLTGEEIRLSPGAHSELIRDIIEQFAPRFVPGGVLVYAGDTGEKWGYVDRKVLAQLGMDMDTHGKMPDVVLYYPANNWLLLVESVTSHGPVDAKRHEELRALFVKSKVGIVYVTAFPTRAIMKRYLGDIAWETEVWIAEAPTHLIHFDGKRFLGPYKE
jgi:adenine-specific DNA-methyltransferase